jgi:DDE domain
VPATIEIDAVQANESVITSYNLQKGTATEIRQMRYLNNFVEHDHRAIKRIARPTGIVKGICYAGVVFTARHENSQSGYVRGDRLRGYERIALDAIWRGSSPGGNFGIGNRWEHWLWATSDAVELWAFVPGVA